MKKKLTIFTAILLLLTACGSSNESGDKNNGTSEVTENENNETNNNEAEVAAMRQEAEQNNEQQDSEQQDDNEEVFESSSSSKTDGMDQPSENLLNGKKVFKHDGDSMIFTIHSANFTKSVTSSNPKDNSVARNILSDNEVFLNISGTLENETKDSISFAGPLGFIRFSVLYDGKHEFSGYGAVEEEDGSDFKSASSIDAFTTSNVQFYAQIPEAVSETDKPLDLIVRVGQEEFTISLR